MKTELQDILECQGSYQPYKEGPQKRIHQRTMFWFTVQQENEGQNKSSKIIGDYNDPKIQGQCTCHANVPVICQQIWV